MAAAYLTIQKDNISFEFTEEQFKQLMQENGIKCGNCKEFVTDRVREFKRGTCRQSCGRTVTSTHFCARFNPKDNG